MTSTALGAFSETQPTITTFPKTGAKVTHVFLAGVGPDAEAIFGGIQDGRFDPASYAEMFIQDNRVFVAYAPVHNEDVLFDALYDSLRGDVELHLLSAGAAIGQRFIEHCRGYQNVPFTITGVTFINPATGPDGLQPDQRKLATLCAKLMADWPRLVRSSAAQFAWHHLVRPLVWRSNKVDRNRNPEAYERYRAAQRRTPLSTIISTTAALTDSPFDGWPEAPPYRVRLVLLTRDEVLHAEMNLAAIRIRYLDQVRVIELQGPPRTCGSHDSLMVFSDRYRWAYHQATRSS